MFDLFNRDRQWSILFLAVLVGVISLAACGGGGGNVPSARVVADALTDASADGSEGRITVGISMYLLVDDLEDPDPAISSARTEEELTAILAGMNEIWNQANIHLELAALDTMVVDAAVLRQVANGNIRAFFDRLGKSIPFPASSPGTNPEAGPETGLISGFYARRIGRANGITPLGSRWFMVMDEPSVFDRRVSSHEVGHILGLQHTLNDRGRLLYPGTNGMSLSPEEITLARYWAKELLKAQK